MPTLAIVVPTGHIDSTVGTALFPASWQAVFITWATWQAVKDTNATWQQVNDG